MSPADVTKEKRRALVLIASGTALWLLVWLATAALAVSSVAR